MKIVYSSLLTISLLATANDLLAQNNYVENVSNSATAGLNNTIVGDQAAPLANPGRNNVFMGYQAGNKSLFALSNVFIGSLAGRDNSGGSNNVFLGDRAGLSNGGSRNIFIGSQAGLSSTQTSSNIYIGVSSGSGNMYGSENLFMGHETGVYTSASANMFIGHRAGNNNTTGTFNTFVGLQAGQSNRTGSNNFMMGTNAGLQNFEGSGNFFLGNNAGANNKSGSYNVFLGINAGASNDYGFNNTAIGFEANVVSGELVNATALGYRALVTKSNSLVLGNGANVGIGTSSPTAKLEVVSSTSNTSGLKLTSLTSSSQPILSGQTKFLTVDGAGNVVLGSTTSGGRVGTDLWEQKGNYLQNVSGNGVVIGEAVSKTPAGYRLYVQEGILTEKVKVAVKNASEWSDYVFAPGYTLTPLVEVEQHIKQKGHLPGVPSAAEVVEQGVDVAKMDAKLLEKIEELTLYSIQLEKENKQQSSILQKQQSEIDTLKNLVEQLLKERK